MIDQVAKWTEDMMTRVTQHNIRVVGRYYRQIKGARLATLLGLDPDATEKAVSAMVSFESHAYIYT